MKKEVKSIVDFFICLIIFILSMTFSLIIDIPMWLPLIIGYVCFLLLGLHRHYSIKTLTVSSLDGIKEAFPAIKIFILVGIITALWRYSGTIAFFLYYGSMLIQPKTFIIMAFILCSILSYVLGTTFGVAGTLGVVLMIIGNSGGVSDALTAGAIMSGIYFGDRCSPFSSCTNLTALSTSIELKQYVRVMLKTSILPMSICLIAYGLLSFMNPLAAIDHTILNRIQSEFVLSPVTMIPVAIMFILPLLKVKLQFSMVLSILVSFIIAIEVQDISVSELLKSCIFGFHINTAESLTFFNGGGIISMSTACYIAMISNTYPAMYKNTDILDSLYAFVEKSSKKVGEFITTSLLGILISAIFCNQSLALMMEGKLLSDVYEKRGKSNRALAYDIGNSTATLAGLVPWCIACSVPLELLGVGIEALPFSFLLYISPICYFIIRKKALCTYDKMEVTNEQCR